MAKLADCVALLVAGYLYLVAPLLGRARFRRLKAAVATDPAARVRFYRISNVTKLALTAVVLACFATTGHETFDLSLFPRADAWAKCAVLAILLAAGTKFAMRRLKDPTRRERLAHRLKNINALAPRTRAERRAWAITSVVAGVSEEILCRAFPLIALAHIFSTRGVGAFIVVQAIGFGFIHLYQGPRGVALTALAGLGLGSIALSDGLLVAMVVHVLIDMRLLLIPTEILDQSLQRATAES